MVDQEEITRRFPRSQKYSPEWICENGFGGNSLWLTEFLCERMELHSDMRVLDLGCGRAKSSIFLAREFGVKVWATDLWVRASENWQRVCDAGLQDSIFPMHADARSLPYASGFFDAIIAVDCYPYFGSDDLYLNYLAQFVRPGGLVGIAGAGLVEEMPTPVPEHLSSWWTQDCWCLHSSDWWKRQWERTGIVQITTVDSMEEGWKIWSHWHRTAWPHNTTEIDAIEADAGRYLTYVRVVGRRQADVKLEEYCWPDPLRSVPQQYEKKPMLR